MSEAKLEGDEIVIRFPVSAVPDCFLYVLNEDPTLTKTLFVENVGEFTADFIRELNKEGHGGETPITQMLDQAMRDATNNGAFGIGVRSKGKRPDWI